MPTFDFSVALSVDDVKSIYEGRTRFIVVTSDTGVKVQLPAVNFRQFVTNEGIYGRFRVTVDENNKLKELRRR